MDMLVEELLLSRRGHSKASMQAPEKYARLKVAASQRSDVDKKLISNVEGVKFS